MIPPLVQRTHLAAAMADIERLDRHLEQVATMPSLPRPELEAEIHELRTRLDQMYESLRGWRNSLNEEG